MWFVIISRVRLQEKAGEDTMEHFPTSVGPLNVRRVSYKNTRKHQVTK